MSTPFNAKRLLFDLIGLVVVYISAAVLFLRTFYTSVTCWPPPPLPKASSSTPPATGKKRGTEKADKHGVKESFKVGIVGAGMSGLAMAKRLKDQNIPFVIFDKSTKAGGTWAYNTYPGCACDVPSHVYSYSFAPNPDWPNKWSPQCEIQPYFDRVAREEGLLEHIRFSTCVEEAEWDEEQSVWRLTIRPSVSGVDDETPSKQQAVAEFDDARKEPAKREVVVVSSLIMALGQLSNPSYPPIPGVGGNVFEGSEFHSARWDHTFDVTGKRVAVIGNGASAIQFIPPVAEKAEHVYVFQRTPSHIMLRGDYAYPGWALALFRYVPFAMKIYRLYLYSFMESSWSFFGKDSWLNGLVTKGMTNSMKDDLSDREDLQEKCIPTYKAGCKRILVSDSYFSALKQPNVTLVNEGVKAITKDGLLYGPNSTKLDVDCIVYGTGFKTTKFCFPVVIKGKGGRILSDTWGDEAYAYFGMTVPDFPNLAIIYGPNTNLGHNSIIYMVECQVNYLGQLMDRIARASTPSSYNLKGAAMDLFQSMCDRRIKDTVWATDCASWYKTKSGRVTNNWCSSTLLFWWMTRRVVEDHYSFE